MPFIWSDISRAMPATKTAAAARASAAAMTREMLPLELRVRLMVRVVRVGVRYICHKLIIAGQNDIGCPSWELRVLTLRLSFLRSAG
jgi:hypothetical protein